MLSSKDQQIHRRAFVSLNSHKALWRAWNYYFLKLEHKLENVSKDEVFHAIYK